MTALLSKKIVATPISYGESFVTETIQLNNVTKVEVVADQSNPGDYNYEVTHKTGSDANFHVSSYSKSTYNLTVSGF